LCTHLHCISFQLSLNTIQFDSIRFNSSSMQCHFSCSYLNET
jgi:hypothetical protein